MFNSKYTKDIIIAIIPNNSDNFNGLVEKSIIPLYAYLTEFINPK